MNKEVPTLFTEPMVKGILANIKTQTRRIVKVKFEPCKDHLIYGSAEWKYEPIDWCVSMDRVLHCGLCGRGVSLFGEKVETKAKYVVGDTIWVKETYCKIVDPEGKEVIIYRADDKFYQDNIENWQGWKPSIFMPKTASRIKLLIEDVKIEKLNDISEQDAIAEGIEREFDTFLDYGCKSKVGSFYLNAVDSYKTLWESINGKGSWDLNPYVYKLTFKKI